MKSFSEFMQTQGTSTLKEGYTKPYFPVSRDVPKFTATLANDDDIESLQKQAQMIATLVHDSQFVKYMTDLGTSKNSNKHCQQLHKTYLQVVSAVNKLIDGVVE